MHKGNERDRENEQTNKKKKNEKKTERKNAHGIRIVENGLYFFSVLMKLFLNMPLWKLCTGVDK